MRVYIHIVKKIIEDLKMASLMIGKVIEENSTGQLFQTKPVGTIAGVLKLLKLRTFDPSKLWKGYADFTVAHFADFEKKYLSQRGFRRIGVQTFT